MTTATRAGEDIYREFVHRLPSVEEKIISWSCNSDDELIAYMSDGSVVLYDSVWKTLRFSNSYEELMDTLFPYDEDRWQIRFAERLLRTMDAKGVNQAWLSDVTNISQGTISNYTTGRTSPTVMNLIRIAKALDLTQEELCRILCYSENKS